MGYEEAANWNITIDKGATWQKTLTITDSNDDPVDLTGYTGEMDIRATAFSDDTEFQIDTTTGNMILGGTAGTIGLLIEATETSDLNIPAGVYDLKLANSSGVAEFPLQGTVTVNETVTR